MKNYIVTVNGNTYDVTVQEGGNISSIVSSTKAVTVPKVTNSVSNTNQGAQGNIKVEAPMAGKILDVKTSVGKNVKKGDVLVILEAMKMENEIVAPQDGVVASINVTSGDLVEISKVLVTLN